MAATWRRTASTTLVAFMGFFDHVEYSVVVPSLWLYLESLGVTSEFYFSIVFAAFSVSVFVVAPIAGAYVDRYPMKPLILAGLVVSVGGQFLYAVAWEAWVIIISRLVCGVGAATMSVLMVYVTRITTTETRTTMMARFNMVSQCGLLLGPAFAVVFEDLDFNIGPFNVNKYTAPGWLMMLQNAVLFVLLAFFFIEPSMDSSTSATEPTSDIKDKPPSPHASLPWHKRVYHMTTPPVFAVFVIQFTFFFVQMCMEAVLTPLTDYYYEFTPLENSLLYCGIVVVFVIVFLIIIRIADYVQDRTMLMIGLIIETLTLSAIVGLLVALDPPPLWGFMFVLAIFVTGLPFFFTCINALLTKLVQAEVIGTAQGLLVSITTVAQILGPIWAGTFSIEPWVPFAGALVVIVGLTVIVVVMFPKLYVPRPGTLEPKVLLSDGPSSSASDSLDVNEHTPLIN